MPLSEIGFKAPGMREELVQISNKAEHCQGLLARLSQRAQALRAVAGECPEVTWLEFGVSELGARLRALREALDRGLALPEFAALRTARRTELEAKWLSALREAFSALVHEAGPSSPFIEALFPHQRFEKLEKSAARRAAYRAEFTQRRASGYVRRMEASADYPYLKALLAPLDQIEQELADDRVLSEAEAEPLRGSILDGGAELERALERARLLAQAALLDEPEAVRALEFDEPKRRRVRPRD